MYSKTREHHHSGHASNKSTWNLADHKRAFRINSRHPVRVIPGVRNRIRWTMMKDSIS